MHPFTYVAPSSIDEAVSVLGQHGEKAARLPVAPTFGADPRRQVSTWDAVVDVKNIPELLQITHDSSGLEFGAGVACCELYENAGIAAEYPGSSMQRH